jgi:hypothetical protein
MAEAEVLFLAFGLGLVVVILFIIISLFIQEGMNKEEKKHKYEIKFKNGRYLLRKKKRPRYGIGGSGKFY